VDLDEILYVGDGNEYCLDSMLLNPVASTIPEWRTFELLMSVLLLNRLVNLDQIVYGGNNIEDDPVYILLHPIALTLQNDRRLNSCGRYNY
jgi:hypothetical protein